MIVLTGARLLGATGNGIEIALDREFRLNLFFLESKLARVLIIRPTGLRLDRTWSLSPELPHGSDRIGNDPIDGRDRLDTSVFPGVPFNLAETDKTITAETALFRVEIRRSPLALVWQFRPSVEATFSTIVEDRPTQAYQFGRDSTRLVHSLKRNPCEHYYGFGEKSGNANKQGRRLAMGMSDALGYDAETSDPLYKQIPFYITIRPDHCGEAVGLFYDNLAQGAFDLGQEIDAYHGPYRSFEADDGDMDLYVIFGPSTKEVVAGFSALTGPMAFPPRWTLSYSGSTMQYTDAPDASDQLLTFLDLIVRHDIPCQSFHLSSGYTLIGDSRYVFTWDSNRFPDPERLARDFAERGIKLIANIKPAMLLDHPRFKEVESFKGFVRDSEDPARPHVTQFWGGDAAFLDFTNPGASAWWSCKVTDQLLDKGIASTWNDNNEFKIGDDGAIADLNGRTGTIICLRPVQSALMMRASNLAQITHAPDKRPFLVSRSGGPGMQRYAQTWTGDNRTEWKTLRYNLRMGHGLSLSGIFNFGHDVGGFAGPKPTPELFMRWIEQGIYWPRFTIHSWNDDGSASEPWMYPELMPLVQAAMRWRERLIPLLYTLLWRAHAHHEPILRPIFFDFPTQPGSYAETDCFMLGPDLLVAPIVDEGATHRSVWLPHDEGGWYDVRTGGLSLGGQIIEAKAPLGSTPLYARAGSMLPLGPAPSWADGSMTLRFFPINDGIASFELYDDDGESVINRDLPPGLIHAKATWLDGQIQLQLWKTGSHRPRWSEIRFEDPTGAAISVGVNGLENAASVRTNDLPSSNGTCNGDEQFNYNLYS